VLDRALRRAAARGVQVEMIVSNWAKRPTSLPHIQSLAVLANVEIRFTNIPPWSGGFIPYARVEHAKFATVDGDRLWIGTANWGGSYFRSSRNLSLFVNGRGSCNVPDRFFTQSWESSYAEPVDPCGDYTPPRRER
jgi:phosphatidylserine/phosphatidylglycerophosphate/cardiolipin synthase-like enzyme